MKATKFNSIVEARINKVRKILEHKAKDYGKNDDRLYTFNEGARYSNCTPAQALDGMMLKHVISYKEILADINAGRIVDKKRFEEKMGDLINYYIIQEAVMLESGLIK